MLDIPMAYLQTNTHLENLEVVEWVDNAGQKRLAESKYGKADDSKSHPIFNFHSIQRWKF
ncbi:MAG TPA: hypothetical protein VJR94_12870 [Candidatus Nitrosocosmicus sp.]|nr:hypothetical protein [Candidatus Nitrosocosmicus sp.]